LLERGTFEGQCFVAAIADVAAGIVVAEPVVVVAVVAKQLFVAELGVVAVVAAAVVAVAVDEPFVVVESTVTPFVGRNQV
jgi:hypothetical protein